MKIMTRINNNDCNDDNDCDDDNDNNDCKDDDEEDEDRESTTKDVYNSVSGLCN